MMPGLDPNKYMVIKNDGKYALPVDVEVLDKGEFFVLRSGDVLASAALQSYVDNVLMLLDIDRLSHKNILSDGERDHLVGLADGVRQMLDDWEQANSMKFPD
jgi:hypothetical protein